MRILIVETYIWTKRGSCFLFRFFEFSLNNQTLYSELTEEKNVRKAKSKLKRGEGLPNVNNRVFTTQRQERPNKANEGH